MSSSAAPSQKNILIDLASPQGNKNISYWNHALPHLAAVAGFRFAVRCRQADVKHLHLPAGVALYVTKGYRSPVIRWLWAQMVLPFWAKKKGMNGLITDITGVPVYRLPAIAFVRQDKENKRFSRSLSERVRHLLAEGLTHLALWRCGVALTPTSARARAYTEGFFSSGKSKLVIAPWASVTVEETEEKKPTKTRDAFLVLAIGDIESRRRYDILLKALLTVRKLKSTVRLMLVGRVADGDVSSALMHLAGDIGVSGRVEWAGALDGEQTAALLRRCAVYVNLDALGDDTSALPQALACGAPTLLSDTPHHREVAGKSAGYLPLTQDADADAEVLANLIWQVLSKPDVAQTMTDATTTRAEKMTWEQTAKRIITALEMSLKHHASPKKKPAPPKPTQKKRMA